MYAAVFEMTGWLGVQQYVFEGDGPEQIMDRFQQIQDLDCLVMMGMQQERGAGKKQLEKLEEFLGKLYRGKLTMEDVRALDVNISIGHFRCLDVAEGEEAIAELRQKYPAAR